MGGSETISLELVLDSARRERVVRAALGPGWRAAACSLRRAAPGLAGFLGDHYRVTLQATHHDSARTHTLHLFVKCLPLANKEKVDFIVAGGFFRREVFMYGLFEELGGDEGPNRWRSRVYLREDNSLVMPDLAVEGFASRPYLSTLELAPLLLAAEAAARLHAAFADYATRRAAGDARPYDFLAEHGDLMADRTFCDCPWLRVAAKLSADFLAAFSTRCGAVPRLEARLHASFLAACATLRDYPDTLNVIIHKDLWINNILFAPDRAVLVDFQCVRYAPPAFELPILLYMTTSAELRVAHERAVQLHYYAAFSALVSRDTRRRLSALRYDSDEFLRWCERGRMFGLLYAVTILPYTLMAPEAARQHFDDPATYEHYSNEDRSPPVLQHARSCDQYRTRQLLLLEEYVDRYILNEPDSKLEV